MFGVIFFNSLLNKLYEYESIYVYYLSLNKLHDSLRKLYD